MQKILDTETYAKQCCGSGSEFNWFQLYFSKFLVINTLEPDPDSLEMIWIRIRIQCHNTNAKHYKSTCRILAFTNRFYF
jgi:hypothetical protein